MKTTPMAGLLALFAAATVAAARRGPTAPGALTSDMISADAATIAKAASDYAKEIDMRVSRGAVAQAQGFAAMPAGVVGAPAGRGQGNHTNATARALFATEYHAAMDRLKKAGKNASKLAVNATAQGLASFSGAKASSGTTGFCGRSTRSGRPDGDGTPEEYCPFCRWCCDCNANGPMDCEFSTVMVGEYGGDAGAVVFCSTCESSCSSCPAFSSMTLCPHGDCCDEDWKHQPPFDATRGVGAYR
mmetsp:Transcript_21731/g.64744  ORF Transcript_21731/g.64744 Transcript_21731/m.64744 type:complete len:245 (-) Transcript_21731:54-788(-)